MSDMAWRVRRLLNRVGVDLVPFRFSRHPIARRQHLFQRHRIDTVIDVGANGGQYGQFLRRVGFLGRIVSYEPLSSAFRALSAAAARDPLWEAHNLGLGRAEGQATLNVSQNSESSSLLPMLATHLKGYPESRYVGTETIAITTLAKVLAGREALDRHFIKIDTQGYEREVLEGAGEWLGKVAGVQLEMSIVSLYQGEHLMPEMFNYLLHRGFTLMSVEPGASDPDSGQLLQLDGLFFRTDSPPGS